MIYTAIDTFYLTDKELENSPSRKDGIDEATEINLRIYGCDLIQESGILLRLPQAVMASGQVLFHRFYCKKSFAKFNVKSLAASCVWVASKLEESPRKARHVIHVFHRMECRREKLPIEYLEVFSTKYTELKSKLIKMERHLLKEMGFVCHVEHPHKFISNYLATLETPPELRQEAWNLANDSLRTTLCVRFKSEVVACGVVYAAARRFQVPLPENPPWWIAFDADKSGIDEVCRVLAHLYSLPKAQYINVSEEKGSLTTTSRSWDPPSQPISKKGALTGPPINDDLKPATPTLSMDSGGSKDSLVEAAIGKVNESKKDDDIPQSMHLVEGEVKEDQMPRKPKSERKLEAGRERNKEREREREKDRVKVRDCDRGRESDRERERKDAEREREEKIRDRTHRSKDKGRDSGNSDKLKHHSSRGRGYSSREKDRHRHYSYG